MATFAVISRENDLRALTSRVNDFLPTSSVSWRNHLNNSNHRASFKKTKSFKETKAKKAQNALALLATEATKAEKVSEEICNQKKFDLLLDAAAEAQEELEDEEFEAELYAAMVNQQKIDELTAKLAQLEKDSLWCTRATDIELVNVVYEIMGKKEEIEFPMELITKARKMMIGSFGSSII